MKSAALLITGLLVTTALLSAGERPAPSLELGSSLRAGVNELKIANAPTASEDTWHFKLELLGWVPWLQGEAGLHGVTSQVGLGPNEIVPKLDMAALVRAEAHRGRLSIMKGTQKAS